MIKLRRGGGGGIIWLKILYYSYAWYSFGPKFCKSLKLARFHSSYSCMRARESIG